MENSNPILSSGQDPYVIKHEESLYYVQSVDDTITITKFKDWSNLVVAENKTVWQPTGKYTKDIWAPELHYFFGKWYIYYAACDGDNANHRMFVLESSNSNPMGSYHERGKICDENNDKWAIDLTVMEHRGKFYAVWSGWEGDKGDFPQNLYIAPMSNPWTIKGERMLLSEPEFHWEKSKAAINEGPQVLRKNSKLFIIYSADASWTAAYKLGMLKYSGGDIMDLDNWHKYDQPVFEQGNTNIPGPGHCSFISYNDSDWIVYHAKKNEELGWEREIRVKTFSWQNGFPVFGKPW